MNINYFRNRAAGSGYFCCVGVADRVAANIGGGSVTVFAEATVSGDSASVVAIATTSSTSVPSGESLVHGMGVTVAIGAKPAVNVDIFDCRFQQLGPLSWLFRTRANYG